MLAGKAAEKEKLRNPSSYVSGKSKSRMQDPDESESESEDGDELQIWKMLPNLKNISEAKLKNMPVEFIFQLNAALGKDKKNTEKLTVNARLAQNVQKLIRHPVKVKEGEDNRRDILHASRYLGGASCALTEIWSGARREIGENGVLPLGNYDMDSVGCGGSVTPKGWQEVHNPSSQEMKLKLFHLPNVANSCLSARKVNIDGEGEGLAIGESMREIADLEAFKAALNTAREAMHSAMPWNRSISAVFGFMMNTNFMQEDLGGNQKRAQILTEFVDYVFGRNALNWENGHNFLTTDELAHVWSNWRGKRAILFGKPAHESKKKEDKKSKNDLCRKFNAKTCPTQTSKTCKTPWGTVLRHLCNKYMPGGKFCEKDHARPDHT
jgi:hypothetical protein